MRETGEDQRSGRAGRPGQVLELDDRIVAVGLEVNVDYLAVCVEDLRGTIRYEKHVHSDNRRSSHRPVLNRLARMAEGALAKIEEDDLVPGRRRGCVTRPRRVRIGNTPARAEPRLVGDRGRGRDLGKLGGIDVRVDNEANLAAIAEHWQGVARGHDNFICVFSEVGVGAGIFIGGDLFRGAHGFGAELGHTTVESDGLLCKCGSLGCLETIVGQEAIARRAGIDVGGRGRARSVTRELVRRAESGDRAVIESLDEAGRYLGIGLASAVNLLDVDMIVLGGCLGPLAPWLEDDVRAVLRERVLSSAWSTCEVRASEFGDEAAVRGAAALTLRSVLAEPWLVGERHGIAWKSFLDMSFRQRPGVCCFRRQAGGDWSMSERATKEVSAAFEQLVPTRSKAGH